MQYLKQLALLPLVSAGIAVTSVPASAYVLNPPPPGEFFSFSAAVIMALPGGIAAYTRPASPANGVSPQNTLFDWFRPRLAGTPPIPVLATLGPVGTLTPADNGVFDIDFIEDPGSPSPFDNLPPGGTALIADIILPTLGIGTLNPNLDLTGVFNLPLIDLDPDGDMLVDAAVGNTLRPLNTVDTFTAKILESVSIEPQGTGSTVRFSFSGAWNVYNPASLMVEQYEGIVVLGAELTVPVSQIIPLTRRPQGLSTSWSGTANIIARAPEPSTLGGLASLVMIAIGGTLRRRQGTKK